MAAQAGLCGCAGWCLWLRRLVSVAVQAGVCGCAGWCLWLRRLVSVAAQAGVCGCAGWCLWLRRLVSVAAQAGLCGWAGWCLWLRRPVWQTQNTGFLMTRLKLHLVDSSILTSSTSEPAHEILAHFVLSKLILQTCLRSHLVGLDV